MDVAQAVEAERIDNHKVPTQNNLGLSPRSTELFYDLGQIPCFFRNLKHWECRVKSALLATESSVLAQCQVHSQLTEM